MEQHRCDLGDVLPGEVTGEEGRGDGGETGGVTAGGGGGSVPRAGATVGSLGDMEEVGTALPQGRESVCASRCNGKFKDNGNKPTGRPLNCV